MQSFRRLHRLGFILSHDATVRLFEKLGENHDLPVKVWKYELQSMLQEAQVNIAV